jgi:N-methylhydantoinase B
MGDLKSQVAACRLAERRVEEIVVRYGRAIVEEAIEHVFDQSEARCRAAVERLPDGVYEAESLFGGHPLDHNEPVLIKVRVTIAGSDMTIDLTQCSSERRQPINARTLAAPLIAYKAITMPRDPVNEGAFRALRVEIQEGNYMMARFPAPMASWGRTLPSVVDTILSALAPILPEKIPAAHRGVLGGTIVFFGIDPANGKIASSYPFSGLPSEGTCTVRPSGNTLASWSWVMRGQCRMLPVSRCTNGDPEVG